MNTLKGNMAMKKITMLLAILIIIPGMQNSYATSMSDMEPDIDRPGSDLAGFDLPAPDPVLCENQCASNASCRAWTYVKPGFQGSTTFSQDDSTARCLVKNRAPLPISDNCCISGVKVIR